MSNKTYRNLWRFGNSPSSISRMKQQSNGSKEPHLWVGGKPPGLWFSVGNAWAKFWIDEGMPPQRIAFRAPLFVARGSLIVVATLDDIQSLSQKYGSYINGIGYMIRWNDMRKDNPEKKGVLLTFCPKFIKGSEWLMQWDVRSGVLWDISDVVVGSAERYI